jgi:alpha-L-fucosidase 2
MLLQSHAGEIELLPALPKEWGSGEVRGLRARGGVEIDMTWRDGKLTACSLVAKRSGTQRLRLPAGYKLQTIRTAPFTLEDGAIAVTLEAGRRYNLVGG